MSLKRGKYGEFWSCLKYPDCEGTRFFSSIDEEPEVDDSDAYHEYLTEDDSYDEV